MRLLEAGEQLREKLNGLEFDPPITHVYNPLDYAWDSYAKYVTKYGRGKKEILFLGMNPGPWGMAQTGIPFGEISMVRDWMGIEAEVGQPERMHPARIVTGFNCTRREVSGARLWGWAQERFGNPGQFFKRFFVINYCPLLFLASKSEKTATNITPDKLRKQEREPLLEACDEHLRVAVSLLKPRYLIGVGAFASGCIDRVIEDHVDVATGQILHPSPASPLANRGWAEKIEKQLQQLGIALE